MKRMSSEKVHELFTNLELGASVIAPIIAEARAHGIPDEVLLRLRTPEGAADVERMVRALQICHPGWFFTEEEEFRVEMPALPPVDFATDPQLTGRFKCAEDRSITGPFVLRLATVYLPHEKYGGDHLYNWQLYERAGVGKGALPGFQHARYLFEHREELGIGPVFRRLSGEVRFLGTVAISRNSTPKDLPLVPSLKNWVDTIQLGWALSDAGGTFWQHDRIAVPGR